MTGMDTGPKKDTDSTKSPATQRPIITLADVEAVYKLDFSNNKGVSPDNTGRVPVGEIEGGFPDLVSIKLHNKK